MKTAVGLCTVARHGGEEEWEVREKGRKGGGGADSAYCFCICSDGGRW